MLVRMLPLPWQVPLPDEVQEAAAAAAAESKPTKLALGAEGGFALDAPKPYTLDKTSSLVVLQGVGQPRMTIPLPCQDLPQLVIDVIDAIQVTFSGAKRCWGVVILLAG